MTGADAVVVEVPAPTVDRSPADVLRLAVAIVALVVILAVLSAWPAAISGRSFPADDPAAFISTRGEGGFEAG